MIARERIAPAQCFLALGALVVLLWPHRALVPLFDGWLFARCIVDAPLVALRCEGHPVVAWGAIMALGRAAPLPGATPFFLPSLLFAAMAMLGVDRLARALLGADAPIERGLLLLAFAVHPVTTSTVLQPNLDVALMAWCLLLFAGVARGSIGEVVAFGTLATFSKETGLLYFAGAAIVLAVARRRDGWRPLLPLGLPPLLLLLFLALPQDAPMYLHAGGMATSGYLHPFDLWNHQLLDYVVLLGVLDYQWVMAGAAAAAAVVALARGRTRLREWSETDRPAIRVAWAVLVGLAIVTAYRIFGNPRYFAMILPLVPLGMVVAMRRANAPVVLPRALLTGWIALLLSAAYRSDDPVMSRLAGRFDAGGGIFYDMTHIGRECCGRGRDQLVYNLQYTDFARAMDSAMVRIGASRGVTVAMSQYGHWHWVTPVDPITSHRVLSGGLPVNLVHTEALADGSMRIERAWLIEPPIVPSSHGMLTARYAIRDAGEVRAGGVTLRLAELTARTEEGR